MLVHWYQWLLIRKLSLMEDHEMAMERLSMGPMPLGPLIALTGQVYILSVRWHVCTIIVYRCTVCTKEVPRTQDAQ